MSVSPTRARELAHHILSRPPFAHSVTRLPDPLGGFFNALGRGLRFVFGGFLSWLGHHIVAPVGNALLGRFGVVWAIVTIIACAAVGGLVVWWLWRRRTQRAVDGTHSRTRGVTPLTADELDRHAASAESAGDFALAVTLRFEAGVERLTELGVIANGRTRTHRQLAAALRNDVFAALAAAHERIAYGEEPATSDDAARATAGWSEVVRGANRMRENVEAGVS